MDTIPVTQETYDQLTKELENLKKVERPKIIDEIAEARAQGDLSENFAYHAAKDRQGEIESRINYLEDRVARATVIKYDPAKSDTVKFGATVTAKNLKTGKEIVYTIVSPEGIDAINGKISFTSPIGKAFLGKKKGEVATVITPKGENQFEIIDVR
ncbi:MAG: transcription elongation factor GreA [Fibrobacteraceae bacterium]|nr:transcription elongation factor GreA [Fibrobacteraceae bacterium]